MLVLLTSAALALGSPFGWNTTPAQAAETGEVTSLTLAPTALATGATGNVKIVWSFPSGSERGDIITITPPADFTLSAPTAFPNGQPLYGPNSTLLATITVSNNVVTVTREIAADSWGDISSDENAVVPFAYSGTIAEGELRPTTWITTSGNFIINITGRAKAPAFYGPSKSGQFWFSPTGEPMITWTFKSPIGPQPAGSLRLEDAMGSGQELLCNSFEGTIRRWDQSFEDGGDSFVSVATWSGGSPETCGASGFTGTIAQEVPAPIEGGNTAIPIEDRQTRVAYLLLNYTVKVTDLNQASTGWSNTITWFNVNAIDPALTQSRPFYEILKYPGNATGNRVVTVTKTALGPESLFVGKDFAIQITCTAEGKVATGFPQTLLVAPNSSDRVYAPIGSTCSATEPDPQKATVTISTPVEITSELLGTFTLGVTNDFRAFAVSPVPPTVTQPVCTASRTISEFGVRPAENSVGVSYSLSGVPAPRKSAVVIAVPTNGYGWAETLPAGWSVTQAGTAEFVVTMLNPTCAGTSSSKLANAGTPVPLDAAGFALTALLLGVGAFVINGILRRRAAGTR